MAGVESRKAWGLSGRACQTTALSSTGLPLKPSEYEVPGSSEDLVSLEIPQKFSILLSTPGEPEILVSGSSLEFLPSFLSVCMVVAAAGGTWAGAVLADTCQSFSLPSLMATSFHLPFPLDLEAQSEPGTTQWMP